MGPTARPTSKLDPQERAPLVRATAWFLGISYALGAPVAVILESRDSVLSARFGLPPWTIYGTSVVQMACAVLILSRRHAQYAAVVLSVTTVGAAISHFRIGSPLTSVPALFYTAIQLWFAARCSEDAEVSAV